MTSNPQKTFRAIALFLVLSVFQVFVVGVSAAPLQDGVSGKLTTTKNQPVMVNGTSASNGQTILSGATIETPAGVGATINLGPLGSIDLAPGSRAEVTFSDGQMKVVLTQGCAIVTTRQGTYGEISTAQGKATNNDSEKKEAMTLDVCNPLGGTGAPIINQGAAANAGAGASGAGGAGGATAGGVGGATGGGIGTGVIIGGIGLAALATAAIIVPCRRGRNPSPGEPRGRNDECR